MQHFTLIAETFSSLGLAFSGILFVVALVSDRALVIPNLPTLLISTSLLRVAIHAVASMSLVSSSCHAFKQSLFSIPIYTNALNEVSLYSTGLLMVLVSIASILVINRGAGRLSEIAARFHLDALPGKQMAIDAEVAAGLMNENGARLRRQQLSAESSFYAAMDGATKFVRAETIYILFASGILALVGAISLVLVCNENPAAAAGVTLRRVAEIGLILQLAAALGTAGASIVVSKDPSSGRAAGDSTISSAKRRALAIAIVTALVVKASFGLGWPSVLIGVAVSMASLIVTRNLAGRDRDKSIEDDGGTSGRGSEVPEDSMVLVELGPSLVTSLEKEESLSRRILFVRRSMSLEYGFSIPQIRIVDNLALDPNGYRILISGVPSARGHLNPGKLLAIDTSGKLAEADWGIPQIEPVFGLTAYWVTPDFTQANLVDGWVLIDPCTVLTTHLGDVISDHLHELLTYQELDRLLQGSGQFHGKLISEVIPSHIGMVALLQIMRGLLCDMIPITNLPAIFEALHEATQQNEKPNLAAIAVVRRHLGRQIIDRFVDKTGTLNAVVLQPQTADAFLSEAHTGQQYNPNLVDEHPMPELRRRLREAFNRSDKLGVLPVIIASDDKRNQLVRLLKRLQIKSPVVGYNEVPAEVPVNVLALL